MDADRNTDISLWSAIFHLVSALPTDWEWCQNFNVSKVKEKAIVLLLFGDAGSGSMSFY
jgi:hypothetical protein